MNHLYETMEFSKDEVAAIEEMAIDRNDPKIKAGVPNRRVDQKRSDYEIHYLGIQAEVYFSELFGVEIHHLPGAVHGDGGNHDYEISGCTFCVKGIQPNAQYLLVPKHQYPVDADVMVLFKQFGKRKMACLGYTTGEYFMENHIWKDLGYGLDSVLHFSKLRPIRELVTIVNEFRTRGSRY